jgi:thiamine pyrophosphokinase
MKCIIIGAGNFVNELIRKEKDDLLICADAGYTYIKDKNIEVDLLVGDFDSIKELPENINIYKLPKEKDETDLYVAILEGIKKGYKEFEIYGSLGGRIEHSIANIQILVNLAKQNIKATLIDQNTMINVLTEGTHIYNKELKGYISLFSYTDEACITIKNLKYELDHKLITNIFPLGIDNEFIDLESLVTIHQGMVLSIINKKND